MKIHIGMAAEVAESGAKPNNQRTKAEADNEPLVAANDNALRWPLIPFPEGWCASS